MAGFSSYLEQNQQDMVVKCQEENGVAPASVLGDSVEADADGKDGKTACVDPDGIHKGQVKPISYTGNRRRNRSANSQVLFCDLIVLKIVVQRITNAPTARFIAS